MRFLTVLIMLFGSLAMAEEPKVDIDNLKREIRILKRVLDVIIEEEGGGNYLPLRSKDTVIFNLNDIQATYLADQGIVIEVQMDRGYFGNAVFGLTGRIATTDESFFPENDAFMFNESELAGRIREYLSQVSESSEDFYSELSGQLNDKEALKKYSSLVNEYRKQQREIRGDIKKLLSEARKKNVDESRSDEIEKEAEVLAQKAEEAAENYRNGLAEIRRMSQERYEQKIKPIQTRLIEALCSYGVLKSLPDDERVTLILAGAGRSGSEPGDKILVFKKQDLEACRNGKMSVAQLEAAAVSYGF
ncbi:MAG: hypothetical protein QNK37_21125 [Acidobacteriota bacterium]|nr:hypothetical protein [Acidobacteriota bacterium]